MTADDVAVARQGAWFRERFNGFVARHEVAWELGMGALAVLFVALGFLIDELPAGSRPELEALELALTALFVLEFAVRILAAHDRSQYLRGHWIDVVALAPPVRALRVLRLLRLLRLVRTFASVYRAAMHLDGLARHRGFAWLVVSWIAVMVVCSIALYAAEHGVNKTIDSPFDALWWGVVTLSTVGYGDVYPITPEGRLAAMVLMLLGIGLFSAITATVTSYLLATQPPRDASRGGRMVEEIERLASLREQGSLSDEEFVQAKRRLLA
ncbi:MAG: ion transporter [Chloroflexi bacterium]|nr:ion transporter [Chloroflexota bacterium]